jgi:hypothetical protein
MKNLQRVIDAYKAMDQRARNEYVILMEQTARKYPMKVAVKLRLVPADKGR